MTYHADLNASCSRFLRLPVNDSVASSRSKAFDCNDVDAIIRAVSDTAISCR